jgi:sporulation protein YqfC
LKKAHKITQNIVKRLELAPEAAGCLRVTLIDNTHAYVENHRGVLEYNSRRVCIRAQQMSVMISGEGLVLDRFGREDVAVRGDIRQIQYETADKGADTP